LFLVGNKKKAKSCGPCIKKVEDVKAAVPGDTKKDEKPVKMKKPKK
jgi:hypothetical protein